MTKPIVSICCVTYNHAPFIRKAIEGFLMQEPPTGVSSDEPWYEILIHDDASEDGTTEIIKEYAAKYPDIIFPLYETENQYSKVGTGGIDFYNYNRAKGRYIAYCEGDDYWTDAHKLQKQVDFMESHPDYSICFHNFENYDVRLQKQYASNEKSWYMKLPDKSELGADFGITDYFNRVGQPLTILFRISMFDFDAHNRYQYYRDTHEIYHLLHSGKGYWMNFVGGVHIKHDGGISSGVGLDQHCWEEREHIMELYLHNRKDMELRAYLIKILLWNHDVYKQENRIMEFNQIVKPYWKTMPKVMKDVHLILLKRYIKNLIRIKKSIEMDVSWNKRFRRVMKLRLQPIRVFCLHHVCAEYDADSMNRGDWMPIEEFKGKVIALLNDGVRFISLEKAYNKITNDKLRNHKYVVLTFDDGYASLKEILPWLEEQHLPATLFINGKYLDGKSFRKNPKERYLTEDELFGMTSPLIEIGSHGWEHTDASIMTKKEFADSMDANICLLSTHPRYIPFHVYTWGRHTEETDSYLHSIGVTPVYIDGMKNYNEPNVIHRELL